MATDSVKVAEYAEAVLNAELRKPRPPACPPQTNNGSNIDVPNPINGDSRKPLTVAAANAATRA